MNPRWPDDYEIYSPEASDGRRHDWPTIVVLALLLIGVGLVLVGLGA